MLERQPLISVVVPTRNRPTLLQDCLASLCSQDYCKDGYEIIVVDDGCVGKDTENLVRKFQGQQPHVRYLWQPHRGLNAARNLGLTESKGDPIIFVDDDIEAPPSWLGEFAAATRHYPNAAALGGPAYIRIEGKRSLPRTCEKCASVEDIETFSHGKHDRDVAWVIGANMAIRREAVHRVKLFNEHFTYGGGDEIEWQVRARRAGMPIIYVARAWLWHRRTQEDMHIKLLKKSFLRNKWYIRLSLETGENLPSLKCALKETVLSIGHALGRQCFMGMFKAAGNIGFIAGWLRWAIVRNSR